MKLTKIVLTLFLFTMVLWVSGQQTKKNKSCRRLVGKNEYSLADYSNIGWSQEEQDTLKVLETQFKHCFCNNQDTTFLNSLKTNYEANVMIEPKIVTLSSCDGLYSFRTFPKKPGLDPYYLNGIMHHAFLVSKNKVYYLNKIYSEDTTAVDRLIEREKPYLQTLFSDRDIETIRYLGNTRTYWTDNSTEVPLMIYVNRNTIHFDNRRKE